MSRLVCSVLHFKSDQHKLLVVDVKEERQTECQKVSFSPLESSIWGRVGPWRKINDSHRFCGFLFVREWGLRLPFCRKAGRLGRMVYRSGKTQGRFREFFDSCQMYVETSVLALGRPFSVHLFPFWGRFWAFSHTAFPHSAPDDFSLSAE